MTQTRRISLRLIAEGVAIVVSILLAFGIEAWWSKKGQLDRERVILTDLESEFVANLDAVRQMRTYHEGASESALELLSIATGGAPRPSNQALDVLLRETFVDAGSLNLQLAVYTSVTTSGDLGIIRDDSLRYALAAWDGVLGDALEDEAWIFRDVQELHVPFLARRLQLSTVYSWPEPLELGQRVAHGGSYDGLLGDLEFQNLVLTKANGERIAGGELADVEAAAAEIIRLARKSLAS